MSKLFAKKKRREKLFQENIRDKEGTRLIIFG